MVLSITFLRNQFQSNCPAFHKKSQLQISIVERADNSNWQDNKLKISTNLNHIINLDLSKQKKVVMQLQQLIDNASFALYISLENGIYQYGMLYPSFDESFWSIRLFKQKPKLDILVAKSVKILKEGFTISTPLPQEMSPGSVSISKQPKQPNSQPSPLTSLESSEHMLKSIDPIKFLTDRYYLTLYNESMMIEHFVKSSIPKMHILTRNTIQLSKDSLSGIIIDSLDTFDARYNLKTAQYTPLSEFSAVWYNHLISPDEKKYKTKILTRIPLSEKINFLESETLKKLTENLKLRDLKLQLLLNLELLKILNSESENVLNNKDTQKLQPSKPQPLKAYAKKSFIGKRKKRLIPTLLGTVLPTTFDFDVDLRMEPPFAKAFTVESTIRLIRGLFDKLCINDAIMGLDYKDVSSSWDYLSNTIIPFYDKHHHRLLSELAIKSRGPAFILKLRTKRERKEREERQKLKQQEKGKSKVERKTSNIDLSKIKLKRSHSSFSTTSKVDLSKKTFSMGISSSTIHALSLDDDLLTSDDVPDHAIAVQLKSSPGGFMTSKKRKLVATKRNSITEKLKKSKELETEVNGMLLPPSNLRPLLSFEPVEVFYNNQVIEATPRKTKTALVMYESPKIIIESSPLNIRKTISSPLTIRKPIESPQKVNGVIPVIVKTPILERVQVKPGIFEIGSSPVKGTQQIVTSSPVATIKTATVFTSASATTYSSKKISAKRKLNFD